MLGQRIVTAVVLLALLVPAMWAPQSWPFAALTLAFVAAAGWEWARLNGAGAAVAVTFAVLLLIACLGTGPVALQEQVPRGFWLVLTAAWIVGGGWALRRGVEGWRQAADWVKWAVGMMALWAAWAALVTARAQGLGFLLSVLCLVWVADIAAYFGGRTFGRRKLAPSISPGKSWEGVWSGMAGVLLLSWGWVRLVEGGASSGVEVAAGFGPSVFSLLFERYGLGWGGALLILLSGMSVVGDLFESLVKRAAGAKDSSRLLPGHGGVLDRIDALLPVFPLALALTSS
ncbi:MAG: phosphatidate cytidylyltransferase [Betaproteobacteria bacterium]|jgi:phosphatidate cytidylyltransferase